MVTRLEVQMREQLIEALLISAQHFNDRLKFMQMTGLPIVSAQLKLVKATKTRGVSVRMQPPVKKIIAGLGGAVKTLVNNVNSNLFSLVGIVMPLLTDYGNSLSFLHGRDLDIDFANVYEENKKLVTCVEQPVIELLSTFQTWIGDVEKTVSVATGSNRKDAVRCLYDLATLKNKLPTLAPDSIRLAKLLDVDTTSTKKHMKNMIQKHIETISKQIYTSVIEQNTEALRKHSEGLKLLRRQPNDAAELRLQIDLACREGGIDKFCRPICEEFVLPVVQTLDDMHAMGLTSTPELLSNCSKVLAAPRALIAVATTFATKRGPLVKHFAEQLHHRCLKLREKITSLAPTIEQFENHGLLKYSGTGIDKGMDQLGDIESNVNDGEILDHHLQRAKEEQSSIEKSEQLLELDGHDFSFMKNATVKANPHIELWKLAVMWKEAEAEWKLKPFCRSFAKPSEVKRSIVTWVANLETLGAIFRNRKLSGPASIVDLLQRSIRTFTKHLPAIELLRHKGMRQRHWDQMMKIEQNSTINESIVSLSEILALKLSFSAVVTVSRRAAQEYKIECKLKQVGKNVGRSISVITGGHSGSSMNAALAEEPMSPTSPTSMGIHKLTTQTYHKLYAILDEASVVIYQLSISTPYCIPHQADIEHTAIKIKLALEVLDQLMSVGALWTSRLSFLQHVPKEDLSKCSPTLVKLLDFIIAPWIKLQKTLMHTRICDMGENRINAAVKLILNQMETCAASLNDFLSKQINLYPRLGNLSEKQLISLIALLCNPNNTAVAGEQHQQQQHTAAPTISNLLPLMFASGIKNISPEKGTATAFDGIQLSFKRVRLHSVTPTSALNDILGIVGTVSVNMKHALASNVVDAVKQTQGILSTALQPEFWNPMSTLPEVRERTVAMAWTKSIENILNSHNNDAAGQKNELATIVEQINGLLKTCESSENAFALLHGSEQLIGLRDNTEHLIQYLTDHDGLRTSDVAWLSQFRVYIDSDSEKWTLQTQACNEGVSFGLAFGSRSGAVATSLLHTSSDISNSTRYIRAVLLNSAMCRATSFAGSQYNCFGSSKVFAEACMKKFAGFLGRMYQAYDCINTNNITTTTRVDNILLSNVLSNGIFVIHNLHRATPKLRSLVASAVLDVQLSMSTNRRNHFGKSKFLGIDDPIVCITTADHHAWSQHFISSIEETTFRRVGLFLPSPCEVVQVVLTAGGFSFASNVATFIVTAVQDNTASIFVCSAVAKQAVSFHSSEKKAMSTFKIPMDWEMWCASLALHVCTGSEEPAKFVKENTTSETSVEPQQSTTTNNIISGVTHSCLLQLASHVKQAMALQSSVIVYGHSMAGKTRIIAEAARGNTLVRPVLFGSIPVSEMIASYDNITHKWNYGYIPTALTALTPTWLVLDGDMDAAASGTSATTPVAAHYNSLMGHFSTLFESSRRSFGEQENTRSLIMPDGECCVVTKNSGIIAETVSLSSLSPGMVASSMLVHVEDPFHALHHSESFKQEIFDSLMPKLIGVEPNVLVDLVAMMQALLRSELVVDIPTWYFRSIVLLQNALVSDWQSEAGMKNADRAGVTFGSVASMYAVANVFGAVLQNSTSTISLVFETACWRVMNKIGYPYPEGIKQSECNVRDFRFDPVNLKWKNWFNEYTKSYGEQFHMHFQELKFNSNESELGHFIIDTMMRTENTNLLVLYEHGYGRDPLICVEDSLRFDFKDKAHLSIPHERFSCQHNSNMQRSMCTILKRMLSRQSQGKWASKLSELSKEDNARNQKKIVLIVEDINVPQPMMQTQLDQCVTNPQDVIRGIVNYKGMWGVERLNQWAQLQDIQVVASSCKLVKSRLTWNLFPVCLATPKKEESLSIFVESVLNTIGFSDFKIHFNQRELSLFHRLKKATVHLFVGLHHSYARQRQHRQHQYVSQPQMTLMHPPMLSYVIKMWSGKLHQMFVAPVTGNRLVDSRYFVQAYREEVNRVFCCTWSEQAANDDDNTSNDKLNSQLKDALKMNDLLDPGQSSSELKVLRTTCKQQIERALHTAWLADNIDSIFIVADSPSSLVTNVVREVAIQSTNDWVVLRGNFNRNNIELEETAVAPTSSHHNTSKQLTILNALDMTGDQTARLAAAVNDGQSQARAATIVVVSQKNMQLIQTMCTHHPWRWLTVVEPPPNQNELVQPILNDPNVFIPQAEVKLLAEMFAVTELVWTAELGIKPQRHTFESAVHTLEILNRAALRASTSLLASTTTALETVEETKRVMEEHLPASIVLQEKYIETLKQAATGCHEKQTITIAALEAAEETQRIFVTKTNVQHENAVREKKFAVQQHTNAGNSAITHGQTLISTVTKQILKRELGKLTQKASSFTNSHIDLVNGICKLLGIKRAKKKKKKSKKNKVVGISDEDLPKMFVDLLFDQLIGADDAKQYLSEKAIASPPSIPLSLATNKKKKGSGSTAKAAAAAWVALHSWALATVAYVVALHTTAEKQEMLDITEKTLQQEKSELASRQICRAESALQLKAETAAAETAIVEAAEHMKDLHENLERSTRFIGCLVPAISSKWQRQLMDLGRDSGNSNNGSTSSNSTNTSGRLNPGQIPAELISLLASASLCLLGPLSTKARNQCRSKWVECIHRHLNIQIDLDATLASETIRFIETSVVSHLLTFLLCKSLAADAHRTHQSTTVHTMASFLVGWSAHAMKIENLTSVCLLTYWGTNTIVVDPDDHMKWVLQKYCNPDSNGSSSKTNFSSRRNTDQLLPALNPSQFVRELPKTFDDVAWSSKHHIIVVALRVNQHWLRYRLARTLDKSTSTRVKRRSSVSSSQRKRRNSVAQGNVDSEKRALVDLNVVNESRSIATNILMAGVSELGNHEQHDMFTKDNIELLNRITSSVQSLSQLELRRKLLQKELEQNIVSTNNILTTKEDSFISKTIQIFLTLGMAKRLPNIMNFTQLENMMVTLKAQRVQKRLTKDFDKAVFVSFVQWICRNMHEQDSLFAVLHVASLHPLVQESSPEVWEALYSLPTIIEAIELGTVADPGTVADLGTVADISDTANVPPWLSNETFQLCVQLSTKLHILRNLPQALLDPTLARQWQNQMQSTNGMELFVAPDFDGCRLSTKSKDVHSIRKLILCIALQPKRYLFYFRWFTRQIFGGPECFDVENNHLVGLECTSLSIRQLFLVQPIKAPIHLCCDDFGVDSINQVLVAGQLSGYYFNRSNSAYRRVLPPGSMQIAVRSIYELDPTRKDYSTFMEMVNNFIRGGGWVVLMDAHLDQQYPGLISLFALVEHAAVVSKSLHPKFRLLLVSETQNKTYVPAFVPDEYRLSFDADHHSACHSVLRHYMNGYTYKPSNDRRIRKIYVAAAYFHAMLCSTFISTSLSVKCPYGASDFQTMLYLIEVLIDDSNIRLAEEDVCTVFKRALKTTYVDLDPSHFNKCVRVVFGDDESNIWPLGVPEKAAGNRMATMEFARGL